MGAALSPDPGCGCGSNASSRSRRLHSLPLGVERAPDGIGDELRDEADIATFDVVDRVNDGALARTGAAILEGIGEAGAWRFQLRFDDRDQLTGSYRHCAERGIALERGSFDVSRRITGPAGRWTRGSPAC